MPTLLEERRTADTSRDAHEVVVRVVGDGGAGHGWSPRDRRGLRGVRTAGTIAGLVAIAVAVVLLANAIGGFDVRLFGTDRVDRSAPVVLRELRDVSTYTAATGEFEATIDIEDDVRWVPSFIAGEHTIFIAVGTVDATIDFAELTRDAVVLGADGGVTITLPHPVLAKPVVDPRLSRVANRDRGLVNRIQGVFTDNPTSERELYLTARQRLARAARGSELQVRAERNVTTMLRGLLGELGYDRVDVVFSDTPIRPIA
jgi:hypothetical protein